MENYFDFKFDCDKYYFLVTNRKLTREYYILNHRKLWFKLGRYILSLKRCIHIEHFKKMLAPQILNNCWLCEYCSNELSGECIDCPLNDYNDDTWDICLGGLYTQVCSASDYKYQFILAIIIATLPVVR